jgi:hypothetical protein
MVGAALGALVGGEPSDEAVEAALATIPAAALDEALRWLAREHGAAALPILRRCLAGRPEHAAAAAGALGTLRLPEAAAALEDAEARAGDKAARTAVRRALYRLRQAGIVAPPSGPPPAVPRARLADAWMSAVDGTGARGLWVTLEGPYGERTLLAAVVSDEVGLVDASVSAVAKKHLAARLQSLRAESPLPWVPVPAPWAWSVLIRAVRLAEAAGGSVPEEVRRWVARLPAPGPAPIHLRLPPTAVAEPAALERSAELLERPELGGWFLDPASVASEALEWLQARESRLVLSEQLKAERLAAVVDRVADTQLEGAARGRWQSRLEDQAYVLLELGRPGDAAMAAAVARALANPGQAARRIPFVRALVERSLEIAGEVASGRLSADAASRAPRAPVPRGAAAGE